MHQWGRVDWELRRSFYETKRSPPSHLCGIVIVFPDIWWCPWQHGGLHEVCSHVLGLVRSMAEMLNSNSDMFSVTCKRLAKCTADPMGNVHQLYSVLLIERGSSQKERVSMLFWKASSPVSCLHMPSIYWRQLWVFLRISCFINPSFYSNQLSVFIVFTKWQKQ